MEIPRILTVHLRLYNIRENVIEFKLEKVFHMKHYSERIHGSKLTILEIWYFTVPFTGILKFFNHYFHY